MRCPGGGVLATGEPWGCGVGDRTSHGGGWQALNNRPQRLPSPPHPSLHQIPQTHKAGPGESLNPEPELSFCSNAESDGSCLLLSGWALLLFITSTTYGTGRHRPIWMMVTTSLCRRGPRLDTVGSATAAVACSKLWARQVQRMHGKIPTGNHLIRMRPSTGWMTRRWPKT